MEAELNPSVAILQLQSSSTSFNSANTSTQFLPRVEANNGLTAWWLNRKTASKNNMTRMFADLIYNAEVKLLLQGRITVEQQRLEEVENKKRKTIFKKNMKF